MKRKMKMLFLYDPTFYICIGTAVTVVYLAALAGSRRDSGANETFF
jgi:hypothetical protein